MSELEARSHAIIHLSSFSVCVVRFARRDCRRLTLELDNHRDQTKELQLFRVKRALQEVIKAGGQDNKLAKEKALIEKQMRHINTVCCDPFLPFLPFRPCSVWLLIGFSVLVRVYVRVGVGVSERVRLLGASTVVCSLFDFTFCFCLRLHAQVTAKQEGKKYKGYHKLQREIRKQHEQNMALEKTIAHLETLVHERQQIARIRSMCCPSRHALPPSLFLPPPPRPCPPRLLLTMCLS